MENLSSQIISVSFHFFVITFYLMTEKSMETFCGRGFATDLIYFIHLQLFCVHVAALSSIAGKHLLDEKIYSVAIAVHSVYFCFSSSPIFHSRTLNSPRFIRAQIQNTYHHHRNLLQFVRYLRFRCKCIIYAVRTTSMKSAENIYMIHVYRYRRR